MAIGQRAEPDCGADFFKAYGLANLRIGMLAGNAELLKYVRKVSSPYNVNGMALDCLPVALADEAYLTVCGTGARWAGTNDGRVARARRAYFPSDANFVLMKIGPKHKELVAAMRAHGVLLRDRSTDPGCDGFVRITIGVEEHVTRGLEREVAREIGWEQSRGSRLRTKGVGVMSDDPQREVVLSHAAAWRSVVLKAPMLREFE